ncbi:hypothetical protein D1610_15620 [Sphingomonas gilva]|uniref:Uncharacterized protein n=1 Tax=Sphingomonas gilva TaxID=2305907 RepID=A0A396RLN9_9SPHN|nr:hypothetical protein [Sphingomonas gilva]RHW16516.1 hypothetical protein D1610_15620 [Sphingomonas gilva]
MRRTASIVAAISLAVSAGAQAQNAKPCVTAAEGEGLALYVMPDVVRSASQTCRPHLPRTALLANPAPLIAKFQAETDAAWPAARAAFGKIAGDDVAPFLDGNMAKPMISAMMGPMLTAEIKPKDCPAINRVVELLQPLPARNAAALFITIAQLASEGDKASKIPLCPFEAGR